LFFYAAPPAAPPALAAALPVDAAPVLAVPEAFAVAAETEDIPSAGALAGGAVAGSVWE